MDLNETELHRVYRELSRPLEPLATSVTPVLGPIPCIKAVIFDIYGTLVVSGTGDISLAEKQDRESLLRDTLTELGVSLEIREGFSVSEYFHGLIKREHQRLREVGADYPEVEIREIWQQLIEEGNKSGWLSGAVTPRQIELAAVRFECRVNPVWPMPGMKSALDKLRATSFTLGIVSNAQFYTPIMLEAFTGQSLESLGFDPTLCVWSYLGLRGKPSAELFPELLLTLKERGLSSDECLFVGNDMLNDIWTAKQAGLKTCLFAGDRRSLRLRETDVRCSDLKPDAIMTELAQLGEILLK